MIETTEILNEIEKGKIIAFCEDKVMFEAVRKHLLAGLYSTGVLLPGQPADARTNWAFQLVWGRNGEVVDPNTKQLVAVTPHTNEQLGADLRAVVRGIQLVEGAWEEMASIKKPEGEKEEEPKHI